MTNISKITSYVDYSAALASLGWGCYSHSWLWIVGGLLSLVVAYLNPAKKIAVFVKSKFTRKQTTRQKISGGSPLPVRPPDIKIPTEITKRKSFFVKENNFKATVSTQIAVKLNPAIYPNK